MNHFKKQDNNHSIEKLSNENNICALIKVGTSVKT